MPILAYTNAFAYVHGYDFTGDSNQLKLGIDVDQLESTVFGSSGYKSFVGGMKASSLDLNGFWQSALTGSVDTEVFPDLGNTGRAVTVGADQTQGSVVYLGQIGKFGYQVFGKIGELVPFSLTAKGTNNAGFVRGQLAKANGSVSAIGALGSGLNLGAVGANQFLYATLHVFGAGTTITVTVESDTTNAFAAPTTRATLGPITTAGGTWATRVAGSITDTWYRLRVTAITGTFTVAGAIGIGS